MTTTQSVEVGAELRSLQLKPISRTTLALFAGASGDHNPMHIDIDVAKSAGLEDVFAHGMLSMAYLGRLLTDNFDPASIRSYRVRSLPSLRYMASRPLPARSFRSKMAWPQSNSPSRWKTEPSHSPATLSSQSRRASTSWELLKAR